MATGGLRAQKKQLTQDAIANAALDLFERQGYDETTIEDIADAVQISPRTFFRYFDSKVDLVLDLPQEHDDAKGSCMRSRPAHESPLDACYHMLLDALRDQLESDTETHVRKFRIVMKTPTLRTLAVERFRSGQMGLVRAFAERLGVGEDDLTPRVLAAAISEAMLAIVERWVNEDAGIETLCPMIDEAFGALRAGFGAPASAGRAASPA